MGRALSWLEFNNVLRPHELRGRVVKRQDTGRGRTKSYWSPSHKRRRSYTQWFVVASGPAGTGKVLIP